MPVQLFNFTSGVDAETRDKVYIAIEQARPTAKIAMLGEYLAFSAETVISYKHQTVFFDTVGCGTTSNPFFDRNLTRPAMPVQLFEFSDGLGRNAKEEIVRRIQLSRPSAEVAMIENGLAFSTESMIPDRDPNIFLNSVSRSTDSNQAFQRDLDA